MKKELKQLVKDTIIYVDNLCPEWDRSRNDNRAMLNAILDYAEWECDEKAVLSCYDMIEAFGLQSSDSHEILNFMNNDDVSYIIESYIP